MPDVTKQITLSGGAPPRQIQCWLKLVAGVDQEAFGYTSTTSLGGADLYEPDNTGLVTFAGLTPNVSITPAGTVYKCTTVFPDGSRIVEFIEVPNQAGPLDFDDLLTTEPSDLPPPGATNADLGGVLTGTVGDAAYVANSVDVAAIDGDVVGYVDALTDLTGWTDATTVLPDAYDALGVVTGGVGVPTPTSGAIGLADEAAGHGLRYRDLGLTAPCSVMVQIDPRYWPAEGGPALFVDLTKSEGWFAPVMTRDLFPPAPATPYFWLASGGRTNATITARDLHAFTAAEEALYMDPERPAGPVWLEVRVDASWTATMWVDGVQIEDLAATIPVALRGSTSHGFYVDVNQTDENGGAGGTRPQDLPVICGPFVARSLVSADDAVAGGGEVALHAGASLTAKGGRVDRLTVVPPVRLYSLGDVAQPALVVRATDGGSDVLTVDDDQVTATVPSEATAVGVTGVNGATQGLRLVGKIATGLPTSGVLGDVVLVADTGLWKVCTVAGTPGTWATVGGGGGGGGVDVVSNVASARILGRTTSGSGDSEELTAAQAWEILDDSGPAAAMTWTQDLTINAALGLTVGSGTASHGKVYSTASVFGAALSMFGHTSDTQPRALLVASASVARLMLGAGGTSLPDWYIDWTSAGVATMTGELRTATAPSTGNALANKTYADLKLAKASNLSDVASAATAFANIKQAASDSATGVVELATTAETQTGTDTARAVTPAGAAATYIPKSLIDAAGDLIVGTADNTVGRLAKGTPLQGLRTNVAGTALEWAPRGAPTDRTWMMLAPQSGSTVRVSGVGAAAVTTGTITTPSVAAVGYAFTQAVSAASVGAGGEVQQVSQAWYRGASSDTFAGVRFCARVRYPDASYNETGASTGSRINVGLSSATPITGRRLGSSVHGMVFNREHENGNNTDTNWQVVVNDGGATATTTNTGIAFTPGNVYEMEILCPPGATSITWTIWDRTAGTTATGTVSTDLPGATTALYPVALLSTVDAVARTLQVGGIYVEAING